MYLQPARKEFPYKQDALKVNSKKKQNKNRARNNFQVIIHFNNIVEKIRD